jgi:hypothetical protein
VSPRASLLLACAVTALFSIPLILRKVPPNRFYGFRTPATLSSPEIWYPVNAFSGWALLVASTVSFLLVCLLPDEVVENPWLGAAAFVVPVGLSLVASLLYQRRFTSRE